MPDFSLLLVFHSGAHLVELHQLLRDGPAHVHECLHQEGFLREPVVPQGVVVLTVRQVAVNFDFFVTYTLWITAGVWFTLPVENHPTTTSRGDVITRVGIQGAMPR